MSAIFPEGWLIVLSLLLPPPRPGERSCLFPDISETKKFRSLNPLQMISTKLKAASTEVREEKCTNGENIFYKI